MGNIHADGDTSDGRDATSPDDAAPGGDAAPTGDAAMPGDGTEAVDGAAIPPLDECSAAPPEWLFCDSFETGITWDGDTANPVLADDPGPFALPGNHAALIRVPSGSGGAGIYKHLPAQQDVAYLRFYVMWEPGHDFTARRHGPGGLHGGSTDCLGCSGSRPQDWFTSSLETVTTSPHTLQAYTYYPGMYMDCADPEGACWGDMFPCTAGPSYCTNPEHQPHGVQPEMVAGQWYCVEQMIDAGTPTASASGASGVLDFWVDGVEIGPWDGLWFRSSAEVGVSTVWLYLYHHAEHSPEGLMLDNVVVSTSRIGCPGS